MEYLRCTAEIKQIPKDSNFPIKAMKYMFNSNIRSLAEDGYLKVFKGVTSVEEVLRVCS